ncbi:hypothetical protein ACFLVG_05120 [Chloroflexota bacterium]
MKKIVLLANLISVFVAVVFFAVATSLLIAEFPTILCEFYSKG